MSDQLPSTSWEKELKQMILKAAEPQELNFPYKKFAEIIAAERTKAIEQFREEVVKEIEERRKSSFDALTGMNHPAICDKECVGKPHALKESAYIAILSVPSLTPPPKEETL